MKIEFTEKPILKYGKYIVDDCCTVTARTELPRGFILELSIDAQTVGPDSRPLARKCLDEIITSASEDINSFIERILPPK